MSPRLNITGRVVLAHAASYADPIRVRRHDVIALSGRSEVWDGHRWLWARAPDGREGWIPDDLPVERSNEMVADRDYSAVELTCGVHERMHVLERRHGWAWCRNMSGAQGWVPLRNLAIENRAASDDDRS